MINIGAQLLLPERFFVVKVQSPYRGIKRLLSFYSVAEPYVYVFNENINIRVTSES